MLKRLLLVFALLIPIDAIAERDFNDVIKILDSAWKYNEIAQEFEPQIRDLCSRFATGAIPDEMIADDRLTEQTKFYISALKRGGDDFCKNSDIDIKDVIAVFLAGLDGYQEDIRASNRMESNHAEPNRTEMNVNTSHFREIAWNAREQEVMVSVVRSANSLSSSMLVDCPLFLSGKKTDNNLTGLCLVAAPDWKTILKCNVNIMQKDSFSTKIVYAYPDSCSPIAKNYRVQFGRGTGNYMFIDEESLSRICFFNEGRLRPRLNSADENICIRGLCEFRKNNPSNENEYAQRAYTVYGSRCN